MTDKKGKKRKGIRRIGREVAFQVLYSTNFLDVQDIEKIFAVVEHFFPDLDKNEGKKKAKEFARELIQGVIENRDRLDEIIERYSKNWRLSRIGKIEVTILRLGIFEMMYRMDVPIKVAIDEAVELSKEFGDQRSKKFVNGILDAVSKSIQNTSNAG